MNKKKIVFFLNSIQQQRCIKRIEEFIKYGYEVDVYGFNRSVVVPTKPQNFDIKVIGTYNNSMPYYKRFFLIYSSLKRTIAKYKNKDVIFYYFLLDIALPARLISNKPFIYEVSDLMHTYLPKPLIPIFDFIEKRICDKSITTVFTSAGFIEYYKFKNNTKYFVIPNKLNSSIQNYKIISKSLPDIKSLKFAFVGALRNEPLYSFLSVLIDKFPQHQFHFWGLIDDSLEDKYKSIFQSPNVFNHGSFSNPRDLSQIYSQIDILLATYDNRHLNPCYAEPNKLYEAIYFETPIIVSDNTYLASVVEKNHAGFIVNAYDKDECYNLINNIKYDDLLSMQDSLHAIPKAYSINNNALFFDWLNSNIL